ncbi:MAG: hypothetical protein WDN03_18050 [Rhizomicrobium sp.]
MHIDIVTLQPLIALVFGILIPHRAAHPELPHRHLFDPESALWGCSPTLLTRLTH